MDIHEHETPWIKRVEELIQVLEGSTIGELELTEAGTEIIIRRRPDMMMVSVPTQQLSLTHTGIQISHSSGGQPVTEDRSLSILSPLTGVYYVGPSPTSPPFVRPGDVVHAGQVVALIEAMKVFNEIQSEVTGRVVELVANNGDVVHKGNVLIRVEPVWEQTVATRGRRKKKDVDWQIKLRFFRRISFRLISVKEPEKPEKEYEGSSSSAR
jgi:acetyl-CoA carboxylase biotin carboxyl carrier protein